MYNKKPISEEIKEYQTSQAEIYSVLVDILEELKKSNP